LFADAKAIVFDLDGTLYVNEGLAREIKISASRYIASLKAIDVTAARCLLEAARNRLSAESGLESTLSAACIEVGGDIRRLHDHFSGEIRPELFLNRDYGLVKVLDRLAGSLEMYIYTNNNRFLCGRIMECLGISGFFRRVFTIEDCWRPKPDISALRQVFARIGRSPEGCIFIGDRYDIDLRLPATLGSPVYLVGNVDELVSLLQEIADWKV
jgi:putative hydrolase of the HAD superfamily